MGEFDPRQWGPAVVPAADLARDPNVPSKREQFRMMGLQTVAQLVAAGQIKLSESAPATDLVNQAERVAAFLAAG